MPEFKKQNKKLKKTACIFFIVIFTLIPIVFFISLNLTPLIASGGLMMKMQMLMQPEQMPINDTRTLLSIQSSNWGLLSLNEDNWSHDIWNVYYDGLVEHETFYSKSGKVGSKRWQLDEKEFSQLNNILVVDFKNTKTHRYGDDGTGYCFTYFDERGNVIHSTGTGYIYGNEWLEGIEKLLYESHSN